MITISAEIGPKTVLEQLDELVRRMSNLRPVMAGIGQELQGRILDRFETQTDPDGHAWAPWADATEKSYPRDGHRRVLDRYGDMMRSLGFEETEDEVHVGFGAVASKAGDVYAMYHEWGTRTMPRRGLLFAGDKDGNARENVLSKGDEQAVNELLEDILNGMINGL